MQFFGKKKDIKMSSPKMTYDIIFPQKMVPECKPEWNREAIMVFSRLPSLRRLQATPLLQTSLIIWKFSFRFADSYNMPLFETSAKNDDKCDHVEAIFLTLAHKINANKLLFKTREELESTSTVQVTSTASVEEESGYCCF